MSTENIVFYRGKKSISVNFSAEEISSDGSLVLLEKLERKHKLIRYFNSFLPDHRNPLQVSHSVEKLLKQWVFMLKQGYEDANDVAHLQHDPLYKDILEADLASPVLRIV